MNTAKTSEQKPAAPFRWIAWLGRIIKGRGITVDEWSLQFPVESRQRIIESLSGFGTSGLVYPYNKYWAFRGFVRSVRFQVRKNGLVAFLKKTFIRRNP